MKLKSREREIEVDFGESVRGSRATSIELDLVDIKKMMQLMEEDEQDFYGLLLDLKKEIERNKKVAALERAAKWVELKS